MLVAELVNEPDLSCTIFACAVSFYSLNCSYIVSFLTLQAQACQSQAAADRQHPDIHSRKPVPLNTQMVSGMCVNFFKLPYANDDPWDTLIAVLVNLIQRIHDEYSLEPSWLSQLP